MNIYLRIIIMVIGNIGILYLLNRSNKTNNNNNNKLIFCFVIAWLILTDIVFVYKFFIA